MHFKKLSVLLAITLLVALSGTFVWLYFSDENPKRTLPRARQVLLIDFEHNHIKSETNYGCQQIN